MVVEMRGAVVVLVFVACNHAATNVPSDGASSDGARSDSAIDGPTRLDAPASGTIRVTVYDDNNPGDLASGVPVRFVAPDSTSQTVFTDGSGVAVAPSYANTTVTVIQDLTNPGHIGLTTFYGLNPGDAVVAGPPTPPQHVAGSVIFELPEIDGEVFHDLTASCPFEGSALDGDPNTIEIQYYEPCATETAATLVYTVSDGSNDWLGTSILTSVDLTAGGTVTMPAFRTEPTSITAELSNIPAEPSQWVFHVSYSLGEDYGQILSEASTGSSAAGTVDLATSGFPVGDHAAPELDLSHGAHAGWSEFHANVSTASTDFAIDASGMIRAIATVDAGSDEIQWSESADGATPTLVAATLVWNGNRAVIYAPYSGSAIPLSTIPVALTPVSPTIFLEIFSSSTGMTYGELLASLSELAISQDSERPVEASPLIDYWLTTYPLL